MTNTDYTNPPGPFEARYLAFLETVTQLRPALHRYCARMTGSVMDGEDIVQEALFEAYRKLDQFDDSRPIKPWLFRIAHNRCIDFLRRRGVRDEAEATAAVPEAVQPRLDWTAVVKLIELPIRFEIVPPARCLPQSITEPVMRGRIEVQ